MRFKVNVKYLKKINKEYLWVFGQTPFIVFQKAVEDKLFISA